MRSSPKTAFCPINARSGLRPRATVRRKIVQRPASERRKAGAEDRSGIDQVGVRDDSLGERGFGLGQHRIDYPVGEARGRDTGQPIGAGRLAAIPWARLCIDDQRKADA